MRLADAVGEAVSEEAVRARFGDDEICVILPGINAEDAYRLAEQVLNRLTEGPEDLRSDARIAGYLEHGSDTGELVAAVCKALNMARRLGGSGIVVAH